MVPFILTNDLDLSRLWFLQPRWALLVPLSTKRSRSSKCEYCLFSRYFHETVVKLCDQTLSNISFREYDVS